MALIGIPTLGIVVALTYLLAGVVDDDPGQTRQFVGLVFWVVLAVEVAFAVGGFVGGVI